MTQDYEPIELTDDTPEPKDEGTYFLYSPCIAHNLAPIYHSSEGWELADVTVTWPELIKGRNMEEKITIQSLAAHDAEVRDKALELTDVERDKALESFMDAESSYNDSWFAMKQAFKAVAEHREEQK